jgi:hypothetical protein
MNLNAGDDVDLEMRIAIDRPAMPDYFQARSRQMAAKIILVVSERTATMA